MKTTIGTMTKRNLVVVAKPYSFAASDPVASEAMEAALLGGGSALHAALAGYFAAAGERPGVILSPMALLLSGYGARRAFDGRLRQPGIGMKRPRGFVAGEPVPDAARVGIPCGSVAAFVALAYDTSSPLGQLTRYGVNAAKRAGAERRGELLQLLGRLGASAFSDPHVHKPIVHAAGATEQGAVTHDDFARIPDVDAKCIETATNSEHPSALTLSLPWGSPADDPAITHETLCVIDARGSAVGLAYYGLDQGLEIDAWQVRAPLFAAPVMRGVTRLPPGNPVASAFSLEIELDAEGRVLRVQGGGGSGAVKAQRS